MKPYLKYIGIGLIVIAAILIIRGCQNNDGGKVKIKIPAKSGVIRQAAPDHKAVDIDKETTRIKAKTEPITPLDKMAAENDSILLDAIGRLTEQNALFAKANDSMKKQMYKDALALKEFSRPFEDSVIKGKITGLVSGEVQSVGFSYTRKEITQEVAIKSYSILAGGELAKSPGGNTYSYNGKVFYMSPGGTLYWISAGNYIGGGVAKTIFKRTKTR